MEKGHIVIAGGTGFIGSALANTLSDQGYDITILTRNPDRPNRSLPRKTRLLAWYGCHPGPWAESLNGALAIVQLSGEPVASTRWDADKQQRIKNSREQSGRLLTDTIANLEQKPPLMIQASAIGYYGIARPDGALAETALPDDSKDRPATLSSAAATDSRGGELPPLDEAAENGSGFLAEVARAAEASSEEVERMGVRRIVIRIGVVLGNQGGMLKRLLPMFRKGLGGPWGTGQQWLSWIHLYDTVNAIRFLLENEQSWGIYNLTAPTPVRVAEFSKSLAATVNRPAFFKTPPWAVKLLFGEMGREILLADQCVQPRRLLEAGFQFQYPSLAPALQHLLNAHATAT